MAYSKSRAANSLGISKKEFEKRAKEAGFRSTEAYWNSIGGDSAPIVQAIQKELIGLDRQLDELTPYLSLTDQEKEAFLQKAVQEITPYYESKKAEIEQGIEEGRLRTAEDILSTFRQVEQETKTALARFDLTQAETEEDFLNKITDLTATTQEDLAAKRVDFQERLENVKLTQVQQGILTSGIGKKEVARETDIQKMQEEALQRRSEAKQVQLETAKKYDLEQVGLARQEAEQKRIRLLGTPEEAAATQEEALGTLGYTSAGDLPSTAELQRRRTERGVSPVYDRGALSDLERERVRAREATAQELGADELARRKVEYEAQVRKINAERAAKASKLSAFGSRI